MRCQRNPPKAQSFAPSSTDTTKHVSTGIFSTLDHSLDTTLPFQGMRIYTKYQVPLTRPADSGAKALNAAGLKSKS